MRSSILRFVNSALLSVWLKLMLRGTKRISKRSRRGSERAYLARSVLRCWILSMFSSIDFWITKRIVCTDIVCPSRWHRSAQEDISLGTAMAVQDEKNAPIAWFSTAGFQKGSMR